jgi:hypothetical protein
MIPLAAGSPTFDAILAICAGVALAAACGFRVFVPLLGLSIAAATGVLHPGKGAAWIGSTPALILLGVATAVEIAAYYIPVIDHFLDTIATPAAIAAGTIATGALLPLRDQIHPAVLWAAALIVGGGSAGVVQAGTVTARSISGVGTGTVANPIVATIENILSTVLTILAIVVPIVAAVVVGIIFFWIARFIARWRRRRRRAHNDEVDPAAGI